MILWRCPKGRVSTGPVGVLAYGPGQKRACVYGLVEVRAPETEPFFLSSVERLSLMPATYSGFVDVGYLRAEGAKAMGRTPNSVRTMAAELVAWFRRLSADELAGQSLDRVYWYDGRYDPSHHRAAGQRRTLNIVGQTPDLELRLGHLVERRSRLERPILAALENTAVGLGIAPAALLDEFKKHWQFRTRLEQKGVDTLLALDIVNFANRAPGGIVVLVAGDLDLAEAVRQARGLGARVLVATPNPNTVARQLQSSADQVISITQADLRRMLQRRPVRPAR